MEMVGSLPKYDPLTAICPPVVGMVLGLVLANTTPGGE
jgi:hypothetical protein